MYTNKIKMNAFILIGMTVLAIVGTASQLTGFVQARSREDIPSLKVLILTNQEDKLDSAPYISLNLDAKLSDSITVFGMNEDIPGAIQKITDIATFDVVIIDCYLPNDINDTKWLKTQILDNNIGLLFFGGKYSEANLNEFGDILPAYFIVDRLAINRTFTEAYFGGIGVTDGVMENYFDKKYEDTKPIEILKDQIQVAVSNEETVRNEIDDNNTENEIDAPILGSIFSKNIAWQSCPLLRERVFTFAKKENTKTLVEVPNTKEPLVVIGNVSEFTTRTSNSQVMFISTGVGILREDPGVFTWESMNNELNSSAVNAIDYSSAYKVTNTTMNEPFKLWPYFNYLMYATVYTLSNNVTDKSIIESYADWPWSPIPHEKETTLWMIFVASLWVFNFWLFFTLGKKKKGKDAAAVATTTETSAPKEGSELKVDTPSEADSAPKEDSEPKVDTPSEADSAPKENSEPEL